LLFGQRKQNAEFKGRGRKLDQKGTKRKGKKVYSPFWVPMKQISRGRIAGRKKTNFAN